jgi:3-hydroxymyristoyl/3-hydroxydecanoyl-(acyl carrier protein) dehydratase
MTRIALTIAADHPAFAGHFPKRPIVPGVVLLDASLRAIDALGSARADTHWRIASAKFLSFVMPGEPVHLEYERTAPDGPFRLRVLAGAPEERLAVTCSAAIVPSEATT